MIAEYTENMPMAAKRDMLWSIGLDSEEGREITRWLAAELLDPGCLSSLAVVSLASPFSLFYFTTGDKLTISGQGSSTTRYPHHQERSIQHHG